MTSFCITDVYKLHDYIGITEYNELIKYTNELEHY